MQMREKVGKSRNTVFLQWFVAPEGRKVGSLKQRVRSHLARWEMKNCTLLWREAHLQVKMYKIHQDRTTFGSWDVEKVHAGVARSTFRSQNVQNTPAPDHFWKLRCRKSARLCGAKHISKSKCTKHTSFGPLLEVKMSKKCTPLWREAHSEVKMYKAHHSRTTFGSSDVEKVHAVVARRTFRSQNVQNTPGSDHFRKLRCWKSARRCGAKHISKSKCTKHTSSGPLLEVEMSKKCTPLWREAHFEVKSAKKLTGTEHFWTFRCVFAWQAAQRDCAPCQKWAKREGFVAFPKAMSGVGHLKKIFKDAFRMASAVQKTCSSEMLGGQGADFLRGVAFWSVRSSGLLRWFCVTGAALRMTWHHFFVAGAVLSTGGLEKSQNALVRSC